MVHRCGVGKHQAELLQKYLPCSLCCPGAQGDILASVMPAGDWGFQPHGCSQCQMSPLPAASGQEPPSAAGCVSGPLSWLAFGNTAGGKGKAKEANKKRPLLSSSCPSRRASYPAARSTTAPPALSHMELSLQLHKHPQTQAHHGILRAVLCRARTSVILPTQDIR